ncbi:MAG: hypothetical protein PUA70_05900 [Oribacterium sp.]|nr:hypothetical protein [Oribacterium sp.]
MILADNLYWGKHASEHKAYILKNLKNRTLEPATYVITEAQAPNLYEIYNSTMLLNPYQDTSTMRVLGIGYGYRDTLECLKLMILDGIRRGSI